MAKHYFCKHCGIYPFHQTRTDPRFWRVNIGCLEGVDPYTLERERRRWRQPLRGGGRMRRLLAIVAFLAGGIAAEMAHPVHCVI